MYKLCLVVAVVFAAAAFAKAASEEVHPSVKIFNDLHREPGPLWPAWKKQPKSLWIDQKLDHFNESETRTWRMRYLANDEFYEFGGPLFVYVGGEWEISSASIGRYRHIYSMAIEHKGYLFATEHRFYGESRPVTDMSNENLQYLSVNQSLADLAHFVRTMKATVPGMENSKVILVGCSYTAAMVTWFKKLYPELATGCWASSGALHAKSDLFEFKELMGQSITEVGGVACYNRIENGFKELENMFANNSAAEAKAMLKLCSSFDENNDMDMATLFYEMSELFANVIQGHTGTEIQSNCKRVMKGASDAAGLADYFVQKIRPVNCIDLSYSRYLELYKNPSFAGGIIRPWIYQTCNELGLYQTSSSRKQPFGTKYPLTFFTTLCADAYGKKFTGEYIEERIQETNRFFGGLNPNVTNVYWTYGGLDPWRSVGILNETMSTIIPNCTHCADIRRLAPEYDSPELTAAKENISALVREWLKE